MPIVKTKTSTNARRFMKAAPVRSANASQATERLIAETLTARIALDQELTIDDILAQKRTDDDATETSRLSNVLSAICTSEEHREIFFRRRAYNIVWPHPANPGQGTALLSSRTGSVCAAQIVLAPVDEPAQHIVVRYAVIKNGARSNDNAAVEPEYFLEATGNPTTILTGNNVRPVTIADPKTGDVPELPSSDLHAMKTVNSVLFELLLTVAAHVDGQKGILFSPPTMRAINSGDFTIVRIQWCCFFAVDDVPRFLQFLSVLFGQTIATTDGIVDLATQLGLRLGVYTDRRTHRVKGVLLEKRHGKNSVFSMMFYDKQKRVAQMRQGKTLDAPDQALIRENVRFDITAHGPGIMEIISGARTQLKKLRKHEPKFLDDLPAQKFLAEKPEQTAWWLERAVYALSHRLIDDVAQRKSFADALVPHMIRDKLGLVGIAKCTPEKLRKFLELDDPIVRAWQAAEKSNPVGWAAALAKAAGVSKSVVYVRQNEWRRRWHVDIGIPYAFYRDLEFFGPHSFTKPETRAAMTAAIRERNGDDTVQLLADASDNFFAQMASVVGNAITSDPTMLRTKLAGVPSPLPDGAAMTAPVAVAGLLEAPRKIILPAHQRPGATGRSAVRSSQTIVATSKAPQATSQMGAAAPRSTKAKIGVNPSKGGARHPVKPPMNRGALHLVKAPVAPGTPRR